MSDTDTCKENIKDKIGIEYFNKKDACALANVSLRTIDNYTRKKVITAKRYGNRNYYSLSDIEILRNSVTLNKKNAGKSRLIYSKESVKAKEIVYNNQDIKDSVSETNKLKHIIDDYAEENEELTKQVNKLMQSIKEKDNSLKNNMLNIESLKRKIGSLSTEIEGLKEQIREKEQMISEFKNDNLALNEEVLKAQADIVELTTTKNNAKDAFNNLVGEIKGIVEDASNKSSEIAELKVYKANYLQVLAKVAKLEKERKLERDEEVHRLIKVNSDLSEKCDKLMRQADQYQMLILDKVESKRLGNVEVAREKKYTFTDRLKELFKK